MILSTTKPTTVFSRPQAGPTFTSSAATSAQPPAMNRADTATVRPLKRPASNNLSERAQMRMIRQKVLEEEQALEDRGALQLTEEQQRILQQSFESVKTEFTDLDGLSWESPGAQELLQKWRAEQEAGPQKAAVKLRGHQSRPSLSGVLTPPVSPSKGTFPSPSTPSQLDDDDLGEDTIRLPQGLISLADSAVPTASHHARPPLPTPVQAQLLVATAPVAGPSSSTLTTTAPADDATVRLPPVRERKANPLPPNYVVLSSGTPNRARSMALVPASCVEGGPAPNLRTRRPVFVRPPKAREDAKAAGASWDATVRAPQAISTR